MMYRIREGIYEHCDGYSCKKRRGYIAERNVTFLWVFKFWLPICGWERDIEMARQWVEHDRRMNAPMMAPEIIE